MSLSSEFPLVSAACILAFFCACSPLMAQGIVPDESDAEGTKIAQTAEFKEFIGKYIAAVNAKNRKALRMLYDPVSQAAMAKDEKELTQVLNVAVKEKISAKHKVTVSTIGPKDDLMLDDSAFAVRPSVQVDLYSSTRPGSGFNLDQIFFLTTSDGEWHEVWFKPPNEKEVKAAIQAMQREQNDEIQNELQKERNVKGSGIIDYNNEPHPKDKESRPYIWEVRMTAADSGKDGYELVNINQTADGKTMLEETLPSGHPFVKQLGTGVMMTGAPLQPNRDGFVGFTLGIGGKLEGSPANGMISDREQSKLAFEFETLGDKPGYKGLKSFILLPGPVMGKLEPSKKGTPLGNGTLRLVRIHSSDANGGEFVTDVVLRQKAKAPATEGNMVPSLNKAASGEITSNCSWPPSE